MADRLFIYCMTKVFLPYIDGRIIQPVGKSGSELRRDNGKKTWDNGHIDIVFFLPLAFHYRLFLKKYTTSQLTIAAQYRNIVLCRDA